MSICSDAIEYAVVVFFSRFFSAFVYTSIDLVTERGDKNEKKNSPKIFLIRNEIKRVWILKLKQEIIIKVENNADTYLKNLHAYEKFHSMTRELHYRQQNEQHTHLEIFFQTLRIWIVKCLIERGFSKVFSWTNCVVNKSNFLWLMSNPNWWSSLSQRCTIVVCFSELHFFFVSLQAICYGHLNFHNVLFFI